MGEAMTKHQFDLWDELNAWYGVSAMLDVTPFVWEDDVRNKALWERLCARVRPIKASHPNSKDICRVAIKQIERELEAL